MIKTKILRTKCDGFYSPADKRVVFYTERRAITIISVTGINIFNNAHSLRSKTLTGVTAGPPYPFVKKVFFRFLRQKKIKKLFVFCCRIALKLYNATVFSCTLMHPIPSTECVIYTRGVHNILIPIIIYYYIEVL